MLIWNSDVDTNGISLLAYSTLPMAMLVTLSGLNPLDPNNYYDEEKGYDGWELNGTFNGVPFSFYTRWGVLRIGGLDALDVAGLERAIRTALLQEAA